ncbi:MAG: DNA polymerase III subunit delta' [Pirellulaceae bacterium]|nr:DNA polymerase III subunit delta' [Pirellulaceae bacterium]
MLLRGHDSVLERFRRTIRAGRLPSTFLFVGPPGIGKKSFALQLAQGLLCERQPEEDLDPCGQCPSCVQVLAGTHPDIHIVQKPADKNTIPIKLLIGEDDTRNREGLCYDISLKPFSGRRKFGIIDDADILGAGQGESANCLLKTLEEPPPKSLLILIGTSEQRQLPTIRSRCQVVRFNPLAESDVADLLISTGKCSDENIARKAASLSGGSLAKAIQWCDEAFLEFRAALFENLSQRDYDLPPLAKTVTSFVESAGKEAAEKRARMREVLTMGLQFYEQLIAALSSTSSSTAKDEALQKAVATTVRWWPGDAEAATYCVEICLDALAHVDSNANLTALAEWWLDELSQTARAGMVKV